MSIYFSLGKIPESLEKRKELLEERIKMEEYLLRNELSFVQKKVLDHIIHKKGYLNEDIETNVSCKIKLPDVSFDVIADIILKIENKRFCFIKCTVNSIDSWERYSIAFCRVANQYWIPFAIVTDGENAKIIDTRDGLLIAEGFDSIPSRRDAENLTKNLDFILYPSEKADKEKRILYAFDAIRCNVIINQKSEHY